MKKKCPGTKSQRLGMKPEIWQPSGPALERIRTAKARPMYTRK